MVVRFLLLCVVHSAQSDAIAGRGRSGVGVGGSGCGVFGLSSGGIEQLLPLRVFVKVDDLK